MTALHLPAWLRAAGPAGLAWWQWLAIPVLALLALALGALLGWLTRHLLGRIAGRTQATWDDRLLERVAGPITLLWTMALATAFAPALELGPGVTDAIRRVIRAGITLGLFWGALRSVGVVSAIAAEGPWARKNPSLVGFLPVGRKMARVVVFALGLVAVLGELGFQVASLVAGLGIGGIALALAAQKTVENLFGSVAIGVDQPFRVGDYVKVDDFAGTVESIGMRSTRFRTLDRTLITIPNGKLSDMRAETFAARDRLRLLAVLGLVYSTRADPMRRVLAEVEAALRAHPKIWADTVSVRLVGLGESTLDVEVMAWFRTTDWNEFTLIRQELLLRFMEIVEAAGTSFAFPTRTLVLERGSGAEPGAEKAAGPTNRVGPA
jgi:MscS family membrane protein